MMRSLILVVIVVIIIIIKVISDSKTFINTNPDPDKNIGPFSKLAFPLYLFRAHTARFAQTNFIKFEDIKDLYVNFLTKNKVNISMNEQAELAQLEILIGNNVNVNKSIEKGRREMHRNRLLILIFLFNISAREGKISTLDITYLDNIYKELGISYWVYKDIRARYIKDKTSASEVKSDKLSQAYKSLEISEGSGIRETKDAYRKLAKKYHPDVFKNKDSKSIEFAEEKFLEITEAYEYLKEYYK